MTTREEVVVVVVATAAPTSGSHNIQGGERRSWRLVSSPRKTLSMLTVVILALYCGVEIVFHHDLKMNNHTFNTQTTTLRNKADRGVHPPGTYPLPPSPPCPDYSQMNISSILLSPPDHHETIRTRLSHLFDDTNDDDTLFHSCSPTCHVRLIPKCPYWELETIDCSNRTKTIGGDEFYLTYSGISIIEEEDSSSKDIWTQPVTAVAFWTDQENGRYLLDFQESPLSSQSRLQQQEPSSTSNSSSSEQTQRGGGVFTVYLQYTCGIGHMAYLLKASWPHGGQTVGWDRSPVLPKTMIPPIQPFERLNNEWEEERLNLFEFSDIIPIGDSLLRSFFHPLGIGIPNINSPLNQTTLPIWKRHIESKINTKDLSQSVLIMGSCAWDILENQNVSTTTSTIWNIDVEKNDDDLPPNGSSSSSSHDPHEEWHDHREALTDLLTHVRTTYPQLTIVWKSCAGFHIHVPYLYQRHRRAEREHLEQRLKHMSTYRVTTIRQVQAEVLQQFQLGHPGKVYYMDVYPAYYLSADRTKPGDGRHYEEMLDFRISNWYVNESIVEQRWRQRHIIHQPDESSTIVCNYTELGWVESVNTALLARVTGRPVVWQKLDPVMNTTNTTTTLEGGTSQTRIQQQQLLSKADLLNENDVRRNAFSNKFVSQLFASTKSGSQHLYGMIFHRILQDLSGTSRPLSSTRVSRTLPPPKERGHTIAIAPFSVIPELTGGEVDDFMEEHLSYIFFGETPLAGDCVILVPTKEWSQLISSKTIEEYNCTIRILPSSLEHPSEMLLVATKLVELYESSSLLLSCSIPASNLFLQLLDYLLYARAQRLGILPWHERFPHKCLPGE